MEKNVPIKPGASKKDNMIKDLIIVGVVLFAGVMLVNTLEDLDDSSIYEFLRIRFDLTGSQEGISETEHIIYPSEAPDDICLDSKRTVYPSTGEGSATWFYYGNCGGWKIYDVVPGSTVKLQARGDECSTCPSCTLGDINYYIYDYYDDQWNEMEFIDGPDNHCGEYIEYYIPTGDRIKIVAESGFYLTVYQGISEDIKEYTIEDDNVDSADADEVSPSTSDQSANTEGSTSDKNIDDPETEQVIYPSEAPDDICLDSKRTVYPSTGEGSATWFYYGNCGGWKIYDVVPGSAVKLQARGDECSTCPSCTLGDINYYIYDYYDGQWNEIEFIDGPDDHCGEYIEYYVPTGDRIKIVATSGFYLTVYQ